MRKQPKLVYVFLLGFLLIAFACSQSDSDSDFHSKPPEEVSPPRQLPAKFQEAVDIIREHFLFFDPSVPICVQDADDMERYIQSFDKTSDYLTKNEYEAFKSSQKKVYIGVGMEIEKDGDDRIICFPYPNSPASKSGIETGDVIESVDGTDVSNFSIFSMAGLLAGKEGTTVSIGIKKKASPPKIVKIIRRPVKYESVTRSNYNGIPVIKIHAFLTSTRRDLKFALMELNTPPVFIIDLRDNPGGDFYQALDAAMLFLDKGALIASIKDNKGIQDFKSTTLPYNKTSRIVLWQNEKTASSAEIFIAALVANNKALSIGKISYGKGTTQTIFELSDGSALILTVGWLLTPHKTKYNNRGLEPIYEILSEDPSEEIFFEQTQLILNR
jgi:carboxyl-terminal processing protease